MRRIGVIVATICAFGIGWYLAQPSDDSPLGEEPSGMLPMVGNMLPYLVGTICAAAVYISAGWFLNTTKALPAVVPPAPVEPLNLSSIPVPEPAATVPAQLIKGA